VVHVGARDEVPAQRQVQEQAAVDAGLDARFARQADPGNIGVAGSLLELVPGGTAADAQPGARLSEGSRPPRPVFPRAVRVIAEA
jgi:hypothetical protein